MKEIGIFAGIVACCAFIEFIVTRVDLSSVFTLNTITAVAVFIAFVTSEFVIFRKLNKEVNG